MQYVLVVIKCWDSIDFGVIEKEPNIAPRFMLGKGFYDAVKIIRQQLAFLSDPKSLKNIQSLLRQYQLLVGSMPLASLYACADNVAYASLKTTTWNFLNYFAFPYPSDKISELKPLVTHNTVELWWTEGAMILCGDTPPGRSTFTINRYQNQLGLETFKASGLRGKDVRIAVCESAGDRLIHCGLTRGFQEGPAGSHSADSDLEHLYKTAGVLFANGAGTEGIVGIAPQARMIAVPFDALNWKDKRWDYQTFAANFRSRASAGILAQKNINIVLLERMVPIQSGDRSYTLPLEILPDMKRLMEEWVSARMIVIEPAGQGNSRDSNINNILDSLSGKLNGRTYNIGLKSKSVCVLVGALDASGGILRNTNKGTMIDGYLWGENIRTLKRGSSDNCSSDSYEATSAAAAIAAGIAACMKQERPELSTDELKRCFWPIFGVDDDSQSLTGTQTNILSYLRDNLSRVTY